MLLKDEFSHECTSISRFPPARFEMAEIVLKNVEARGAIGSGKSFGIF